MSTREEHEAIEALQEEARLKMRELQVRVRVLTVAGRYVNCSNLYFPELQIIVLGAIFISTEAVVMMKQIMSERLFHIVRA